MFANVVVIINMQAYAQRKAAIFVLLTRNDQRNIIKEDQTVGTYGTRGSERNV
jgi:hypothetical protein